MSHRFTISIIEPTGARYFELPNGSKSLIKYAVLGLASIILLAFLLVVLLQHSVSSLETKKQEVEHRLSLLTRENSNLNRAIHSKSQEFDEIDNKVDFIEQIIGMEATPDLTLPERMELARMVIARREQEFRLILNKREQEFKEIGTKIESLEGMIGLQPQNDQTLLERVTSASSTATQKKFMISNLPSGSPIEFKGVTSDYGSREHPTLKRKEFHSGVDLRAALGTSVKATADGVVEFAGFRKKSGYGNLVIVRHSFGFRTSYGHLQEVLVEAGDFVKKGDKIAKSGNTGRSSGPHLHYEVRFIHSSLDPDPFIKWSLDNYEVVFQEKGVKWQSLINLVNRKLTNQTPPSLQLAQK